MTQNILIINFRRYGDIYSTAHLVGSIKKTNPDSSIHLLVYDEFKHAANCINNIDSITTVNRKQILSLLKNPIFSKAHAIEYFHEQIDKIDMSTIDTVVNYSNDQVSCYLSSYLYTINKSIKKIGISYNNNGLVEYSNDWSIIFNDVITSLKDTPISFTDCYHGMLNLKRHPLSAQLITRSEYDQTAAMNLHKIRMAESHNGQSVMLVGIQLKSSSPSKNIPSEAIIELIDKMLDDPKLYPIILIAPQKDERILAQDINNYFDNALITIESDFIASASVIKNLDLLLTPDTVMKHIADIQNTPSVEVSLGPSPFLKQGSCNPQSLILTPSLNLRTYQHDSNENVSINGMDLYNTIQLALDLIPIDLITIGTKLCIYKPYFDSIGVAYKPIVGKADSNSEIYRFMYRYFISKKLKLKGTLSFSDLHSLQPQAIHNWIKEERSNLTEFSKSILSTLRSLTQAQQHYKKSSEFISSLETILQECERRTMSTMPALFFRAHLESLSANTLATNIRRVETLLYTLKDDIQIVLTCINELENEFLNKNYSGNLTIHHQLKNWTANG